MSSLTIEPIEATIGRFQGGPVERRGDRSGRLWWVCPFHDDRNPSLCVTADGLRFRCFGCGACGDGIDFIRRLNPEMGFREAAQTIGANPARTPRRPSSLSVLVARPTRSSRPEGWQDFARAVVTEAEAALWSGGGVEARSLLIHRGLTEATIRAARLGCCPSDRWVDGIYPDGKIWIPCGILIPWFDGPHVVLLNVRRLQGKPKYVAVRGSRRDGLFPALPRIEPGKPVVIVEGEFDALLLGQELAELAPVVTLGSAGSRASSRIKRMLLPASPWIVAGDSDPAGEKSAHSWLSSSDRCVRVAPPLQTGKDWTEAHLNGLNLREWWQAEFARRPAVDSKSEAYGQSSSISTATRIAESGPGRKLRAIPTPRPSRLDVIGGWSVEWREYWAYLSDLYHDQGMPLRAAEVRAVRNAEVEMKVAGLGPPPSMAYDPQAKLWRDLLAESVATGEAARFLVGDEYHHAGALLAEKPSNADAQRSVYLAIRSRYFDSRYRALGIPNPADEDRRWRCHNPYCLQKGGWWTSAYGVVNCRNCRPPALPEFIVAEGHASDAPFVEPDRSNQAIAPYPTGRTVDVNSYSAPVSAAKVEPTTHTR